VRFTAEAAKKGDVTFFEKILTRDYILIEADGHMSTNLKFWSYTAPARSNLKHWTSSIARHVYGNIAIVISELAMKGHSGRTELNGTYRSTDVLERRPDGHWQSLSSQLTKLHNRGY